MPRNVEIKASVRDVDKLTNRIFEVTQSLGTVSKQEDTFFKVENGRLKLRIHNASDDGELIFYDRPNQLGPKLSDFNKTYIADAQSLRETLSKALGIVGTVKKTRRLYMLGQTRIHVDQVQDLGAFVELEVMLDDAQSLEDGEKIANEIVQQLGIEKSGMQSGAYMDLLLRA